MAIQSQPSRISEPFAGSGTKNVIPSTNTTPSASQAASWASGFPPECSQPISAGGCPVPRNDVNGVLNQISQDYSFRQDGGVWEWSALADYDVQRMVRGSDGLLYWSVAQSGPGVAAGAQDPTLDSSHVYWALLPTNDADLVHKAGTEDITGSKEFLADLFLTNSANYVVKALIYNPSEVPSSDIFRQFGRMEDVNSTAFMDIYSSYNAAQALGLFIRLYSIDHSINAYIELVASNDGTSDAYIKADSLSPTTNGVVTLGKSSRRWGQIYSSSSSISTSDSRLKTKPEPFPDAVMDAWSEVKFVQFQMLDAVRQKGADAARLHSGLVAQRIDAAFKARGLDARRYGLFCWDQWEAMPETRDEKGEVVSEAVDAGDMFSLRYEEALCMEAAYQRRRADRAEARLAALEERLAAIEAKLG